MTGYINPLSAQRIGAKISGPEKESGGGVPFANYLKDALGSSDQLQKEADRAALNLLSGDLESLHELMITTEQAQLSLQLSVQVVNKVIQAYQEIYRMQV
ncbi:MAG: flagellar hook-basal body complex protein FliE [Firmicutes bacterium]|nr:flagellar hook-basal body complex protein FliE [Bacillota bacterium]